ncbi:MAG: hypothetical protein ACLQVL_28155 [Terriglobia bacterium]
MKRTRIIFCTVLLFVTSLGMLLRAQAPAGRSRPAGVPDDYVITPFGYFHPSCVLQVAAGETLFDHGRTLQHADGTREDIPACRYPHYVASGVVGAGAVKVDSPTINGWVEDASVSISTSYGKIVATWTVPPGPPTNVGQTIFFFPGMEDKNDVVSILQPVLQWGSSSAGGGNYWAIASWNCCPSGIADYSTPVEVSTGDQIQGTVMSTCAAGTESCPTWDIETVDTTSGKSSNLSNSPSEGQTFNWAFGGVLEAYDIAQCFDYPLNRSLEFSNIALYDYNFNQISNPAWTSGYTSDTPQCGYSVATAASQVTVHLPSSSSINCGTVNFGTVHSYPDFKSTTCVNTINDTWNLVQTVYVSPAPPQPWVIGGPSVVNPDQNFQVSVGWEPAGGPSEGSYWGSGYFLYEDAEGNYLYVPLSYQVLFTP